MRFSSLWMNFGAMWTNFGSLWMKQEQRGFLWLEARGVSFPFYCHFAELPQLYSHIMHI